MKSVSYHLPHGLAKPLQHYSYKKLGLTHSILSLQNQLHSEAERQPEQLRCPSTCSAQAEPTTASIAAVRISAEGGQTALDGGHKVLGHPVPTSEATAQSLPCLTLKPKSV